MEKDFASVVKNNSKFIQQYSLDDWVSKLKKIALMYIPFPTDDVVDSITNTKNYVVEYKDLGINKIVVVTSTLSWEDIRIELNCLEIKIERQEGHSKFEPIGTLPLEVLRMFLE